MNAKADWIAVDWGTSNLRAWGMDAEGRPVFAHHSDRGMGKLKRDEFAPALLDLLAPELGAEPAAKDVLICGMVGAKQGWVEAPYFDTPAELTDLPRRNVEARAGALRCRILPGLARREADAEDVMRGEETQILGLLRLRPSFSGTAILPGTHSKWVDVADGRVMRFATALTGELFELLSTHSVLRHSLGGETNGPATEDGIANGIEAGLAQPELLSANLFRTRAAALLSGRTPDWCAGYLSGLLVGSEVGGHRDWLDGGAVPLIGSARLCRLYGAALARLGIESVAIDAAEATLAGLTEARSLLAQ